MSLQDSPLEKRHDFNFTNISVIHKLIFVAVVSALLWVIIAATISI